MSKVIRIDDETFSRLQGLAEPLIDTPSDVIVRLLNYFESSIRSEDNMHSTGTNSVSLDSTEKFKEEVPLSMNRSHNLFLAPALDENIKKTIRSSVSFMGIRDFLSTEEKECLQKKSPDLNILYCWAMTESRRMVFDSMKEGDFVLFTIKNSGKFQFCGEVTCKINNEKLGNHLWNLVPNKPWKLIYFLKNIRVINVDKAKLVNALSYSSNYNVPGVIRVNRINLEIVLNRYGNLVNLIESLEENKKG